ncbi:MAG: hypothetical protein QME12_07370 [Nanoarchaeota archaeon]|nr:hypothetical protein [Nanoarchaeota archaeon]
MNDEQIRHKKFEEISNELGKFCKSVKGEFIDRMQPSVGSICRFTTDDGKKIKIRLNFGLELNAEEEGKKGLKGIYAWDADFWEGKTDTFFTALTKDEKYKLQVSKGKGIW